MNTNVIPVNGNFKLKAFAVKAVKTTFIGMGVLPFLILAAMVIFSLLSDNFLTSRNLLNVGRQSSYLIIVSMGQMLALITGGFDLSVGTVVALSSVTGAMAMAALNAAFPGALFLIIGASILVGMAVGMCFGTVNGIGISLFKVNPFMMTLGMSSVGFGIALYLTGGVPVYGLPEAFSDIFGFGDLFGVPTPVIVTLLLVGIMYFFMNWTVLGRYFYAVGGNIKASALSGINTKLVLYLAYLFCSGLSTIAGLMLTARLETGEANIGVAMPLESIAACVIGGVSLKGGVGRIENVVLGALFIGLIQNGMNLARIESYLQTVVIGVLLIFAVCIDQFRHHIIAGAGE
jgi:ribose transport system permease protein